MKPDDFDGLILLVEPRTCERCKSPTLWARPKQSTHGFCVHHSRGGSVSAGEAFRNVQVAFSGVTALRSEPMRWARGEYPRWVRRRIAWTTVGQTHRRPWTRAAYGWGLPEDCGPCGRCRVLIQLYGPDGYPLCRECAEQQTKQRSGES